MTHHFTSYLALWVILLTGLMVAEPAAWASDMAHTHELTEPHEVTIAGEVVILEKGLRLTAHGSGTSLSAVIVQPNGRRIGVQIPREKLAEITPGPVAPAPPTKPGPATTLEPRPEPPPPVAEPPRPSGPPSLNGTELRRGHITNLKVPLSEDLVKLAQTKGNPHVAETRLAIAVPGNFDPSRPHPILVVSSTSAHGRASCLEALNMFWRRASEKGWVVIAAQSETHPKQDSNEWRWAMIQAGVQAIRLEWPQSESWPMACIGYSGGGKRSGYIAALMSKEQWNLIGIFMGGVNEDMASAGLREYRPPRREFTSVPIFVSAGKDDRVAPPDEVARVERSLRSSGFNNLRVEIGEGGHQLNHQHVVQALDWFLEQSPTRQQ